MPKDPYFGYDDRPERAPSAEPVTRGPPERKRRRKVLSCYTCRSRKLQCDRGMPACGRCTKAGQAANCLYIDDPSDSPAQHVDSRTDGERDTVQPGQSHAPTSNLLDRLEYQDKHIKQLEAALAQYSQATAPSVAKVSQTKLPLTPESAAGAPPHLQASYHTDTGVIDADTLLLRGRSFKTQFHGATHVGALIAYVPGLSKFTKETFETFPAFARIRHDMKALENRTVYAGAVPALIKDEDLKNLLAPRAETDRLTQLYLDHYDTTYHIIHVPTFRRDYQEMWQDIGLARPHIIALVLVMSASCQLMSTSPDSFSYTANSSNLRECAVTIISAVEHWLQTQGQKHVTILDFQIRFILLLAKRVSIRKAKRHWTEANHFLNFCISAGLHRDPDLLRKPTSPADKEMRRRMWAAVCEFELQMAFERGMVSAAWPLQSDCPAPSNIADDDFDQTTDHLPPSKPSHHFTEASWLAVSHDSLASRLALNTALNNIRLPLSFDEGKRHAEQIEGYLRALPKWIGSTSEGPRAMLELNLRQYTLVIYNRLLRHADSQTEKNFCRFALLENSVRIVDIFKSLAQTGPPAVQLLREDLVRAACSISHVSSTVNTQSLDMVAQVVNSTAEPSIEDAIVMLTDNIGRYGREQRQLWMVVAANGYMKTSRDPANKSIYMQEAVDKITKPYYQILARQGKAPTGIGNPDSVGIAKAWSEKGFIEYLPNDAVDAAASATRGSCAADKERSALVNADDDPPLLDLEELAAWTFEDWAITPSNWNNLDGGDL